MNISQSFNQNFLLILYIRIPSYCDRILYKIFEESPINECQPIEYTYLPEFNESDHKPVVGMFKLKVNTPI